MKYPYRRSATTQRCRLLPLAIALALAGTATAQDRDKVDTAEAAGKTVYLSPLVAEADEADPYAEPSAKSVISADQIGVFGDNNLDDALRATPGTFTRDSPQNPGIAVNIRGVEGSGRVNMTIDGVRQNFRFTGHEAQGLVYVDSALLAGIDINRGAVSTAGGAGALAGTANFRTLGIDDVLRDRAGIGGFLNFGWGSNGGQFGQSAALAYRGDNWGFVAAGSMRAPDDYRNGNDEIVAGTGQDLLSGLLKFEFMPGENHRINIGAVTYDNEFLANSYRQKIDSRQYTARYAFTPDSDLVDLRVNVHRSDVTMSYYTAPGLAGGGGARGRVIEDIGTGFELYNTSVFNDWLSSTYGVEYFHDDIDVINSSPVPNRGVNPSGESAIASVFSDTTLRFGIFEAIVGLRYDRFTAEGSGSVTANNPHGMPAGPYVLDRKEGEFNPKLTLALNPVEWWQPYLTWSRSFRPPTVSELLTGGDHPAEGGPPMSFFPNPFLEPEVSTGWELGSNFHRQGLFASNDRLSFKLAYFRNEIADYITAAFAPTGGVFFGNNPGKSEVKGIEVEGGYDAGFVFGAISYSDTDSELPSQINGFGAQSYVPDRVASATLGVRFFEERLTVGGRWFHVSDAFIGDINTFDDDPWDPGYNLVDAFGNYTFGNGTQLRLNVSNLTDKAFTPVLSTPAGGNLVETGRGRTWTASVRIPF